MEVWERIKKETGLNSMKNLAVTVNISPQAVSEMKSKGKFPPGWAYIIGEQFNLLTEWIMKGKGPKRIDEKLEINPLLIEINSWLNEEIKKNPKKEIWFEVEFERSFYEFKKWKEEKEGAATGEDYFANRKVA